MNRKKISLILLGTCFSFFFIGAKAPVNVHADNSTSTISRLGGQDRYKTAVTISKSGWTYGADTVILASGEGYADALCAAPLAKKYNAPILLTTKDSISDDTINELKRLEAKKVILIGGTSSISDTVSNKVKSATSADIERIAGQDRYETSAKVAEQLGTSNKVIIASGEDYADALSAAPIAASKGMPILLTPSKELSSSAAKYIKDNNVTTTYIIGGNASVDKSLESNLPGVKRLSGADRYETNISVISNFINDLDTHNAYVALGDGVTGSEFADALSGTAIASKNNAPVFLTYFTVPKVTKDFITSKLSPDTKITALGGKAVVGDDIINQLAIPTSKELLKDAYTSVNNFISIGINSPSSIASTLADGGVNAQTAVDKAKSSGADTKDIAELQTKLTNQINKAKERTSLSNVKSSITPVMVSTLTGLPNGVVPTSAITITNNNVSSLDSKFLNQIALQPNKNVTLDVYYKSGTNDWVKNTLMLQASNKGYVLKSKLPLNSNGTVTIAIVNTEDDVTLTISNLVGTDSDYQDSPVILKSVGFDSI